MPRTAALPAEPLHTDPLHDEQARWRTAALLVLTAVAVGAALASLRVLMVPFVLALFLTYLIAPLIEALERRGAPHWAAVGIGFLAVAGMTVVIGVLVASAVRELLNQAELYEASLRGLVREAFSLAGVEMGRRTTLEALRELPLLDLVGAAAGTVVSLFSTLTMVILFTLFLLAGRRQERRGIWAEIDQAVRRYVGAKFVVSAVTGILVGLILYALGFQLAIVFGVLAFLLNFIPYIGSVVSTLLPLPLAFAQYDSWWLIVAVVVLPGAVQLLIGNVVEPIVQGSQLDLHPVTILLALGVWGTLWGVPGMFLAAPITAVMKIFLARFETTRPVADAFAGRLPRVRAAGPA